MNALLPVLAALFAAQPASAEPFLSRDASAYAPGAFSARVDGWWGASRGAFAGDRSELTQCQVPGTALVRGAALEARVGLPGRLELSVAGGYSFQEVKVDRWDSASGWQGADVLNGEGADDAVVALKWSALKGPRSALALEAGVRIPAAPGPDRAGEYYGRLGDGSWGFPLGLRATHYGGTINAYASFSWEPALKRYVGKWNGVALPGKRGFMAGQSAGLVAGAEVSSTGYAWALELAWSAQGRDHGAVVDALRGAGRADEARPETEAVTAVPSLRVSTGPRSDILVAFLVPLDGRRVYRMFTGSVAWRRSF